MRPLYLEMTAFGSYGEKTVLPFEELRHDLYLVTGDTGAGKTTIFDAIMFALFGRASGTERKGDMLHCDLVPKSTDTVVMFGTATNEAMLNAGSCPNPKNRPGSPDNLTPNEWHRGATKWWYYFLRLKAEGNRIAEIEEMMIPEKLVHFETRASDYVRRAERMDKYVPESERLSREEMIAVADTYWEGLQKTVPPEGVLAHPDSDRLEMGVECINARRNYHTMQSNFRSPTFLWQIRNRRWVIADEERGVLVCIANFTQIDEKTPPGFVAAEIFKIECGLIRDILAFFKPMTLKAGWGEE